MVLITGARQTGKSTLTQHCYAKLPYINLDAFETRQQIRQVSTFDWAKTIGKSILDEAQKEPRIFEKIKYAFDAGDLPFSVLLGPSQVLMLKQIRESLAGRATIYELFPFMLSEMVTQVGEDVSTPLLNYKWIKTNRLPVQIFFYRTHNGVEVDLVLQIQQKYIGVEIKSRDRVYSTDIKSLVKLAEQLKENWLGGILIYRGDLIEKIAEPNIWAIPSWRLLS